MNPCELNVLITAVTNYLYCSMSPEDFRSLHLLLEELCREMQATIKRRELCERNEK